MNIEIRKKIKYLFVICGAFWVQTASSIDVNIKITGEIIIPPCKINGNDVDINVSFGKIGLRDVDGNNFSVSKTINVNCEYYEGKPYIILSSGAILPGAPDHILQTTGVNSSSLGIALYQGGGVDPSHPLRIGAGDKGAYGYKIEKGLSAVNEQNSQFTFTAVPYKQGSSDLIAGTFSSSVTMNISYL
ncbi:Minor fimbrial protein prsF precursor [Citrobacter freundii]|nr:Minor fimbrial protein prsF precursor [Citrobacter freundii]